MSKLSLTRVTVYAAVVVLLGLVSDVAAGLIDVPRAGKPWVLGAAAVLAVAVVLVDVHRAKATLSGEPVAARDKLATLLDTFAEVIASQWHSEEQFRRIHDPFPLPIRWTPAAGTITDHWANIRRASPEESVGPLDLRGSLETIVDVYRRIPSGRLVILGRAGAGKTISTVRFLLDSVRRRRTGDPVPVIFRLGSWDPNGDCATSR